MSSDITRFRRNEAIPVRQVGDVLLMVDPVCRDVVALGGAGPVLWDLLAEPLTIGEAISRLAEVHGVSSEAVSAEVRDVFNRLAEHHVLLAAS